MSITGKENKNCQKNIKINEKKLKKCVDIHKKSGYNQNQLTETKVYEF